MPVAQPADIPNIANNSYRTPQEGLDRRYLFPPPKPYAGLPTPPWELSSPSDPLEAQRPSKVSRTDNQGDGGNPAASSSSNIPSAAASMSVISSGAASSANADIIMSAASSASTFPACSNEPPTKKARILTRFTSAEAVEEAFR